jgi:ribosomal protein S1
VLDAESEPSEGDVVTGTVVHIDKDGVLVDVGSKSEGIVRPNELSREPFSNIEDVVKVGESIKVVIIGRDNEDGSLLLSKKRADFEKAWDKVIEALNSGTVLHAMVTERVKGGLVVDLGIRGFVPASHVGNGDFKHQNLDKYVGQSVPLKVIEVDRDRRKVVLSHRLATQEEREQRKAETIASLKEGDVRRGIVRRVTDYGAFIDVGGIDGLLHVSEMSWARIKHPSEVVKNGQELDVMIPSSGLTRTRRASASACARSCPTRGPRSATSTRSATPSR